MKSRKNLGKYKRDEDIKVTRAEQTWAYSFE